MNPNEISPFADRVAKALEKSKETDSGQLSDLADVLAALAAQMSDTDAAGLAARGAAVLIEAMETGRGSLLGLAKPLIRLTDRLNPASAAPVASRAALVLVNALENRAPDEPAFVGMKLSSFVTWIPPMEAAGFARRGAESLTKLIEKERDGSEGELVRLALSISMLSRSMRPADARIIASRTVPVLTEAAGRTNESEPTTTLLFHALTLASLSTYLAPADAVWGKIAAGSMLAEVFAEDEGRSDGPVSRFLKEMTDAPEEIGFAQTAASVRDWTNAVRHLKAQNAAQQGYFDRVIATLGRIPVSNKLP